MTLGARDGLWMREVTKVAKAQIPVIPEERCTIRVTAPAVYRQQYKSDTGSNDSATDVVRDLAAGSGVQLAELLGGNWTTRTVGDSSSLVGFLRLKPAPASKLESANGTRGVFVAKVGKNVRPADSKPFWIQRLKQESREITCDGPLA